MFVEALVIDDSGTTRRIIAGILRDLGFRVSEASNGCEALKHLRQADKPRLMVVDWNMPVLDGLGVIKAVREDRQFDDVSVLMVTTEIAKARIVEALDAGANEYVMKPFTREMFIGKLALLGFGDWRAP